jgi:hypothetical protein
MSSSENLRLGNPASMRFDFANIAVLNLLWISHGSVWLRYKRLLTRWQILRFTLGLGTTIRCPDGRSSVWPFVRLANVSSKKCKLLLLNYANSRMNVEVASNWTACSSIVQTTDGTWREYYFKVESMLVEANDVDISCRELVCSLSDSFIATPSVYCDRLGNMNVVHIGDWNIGYTLKDYSEPGNLQLRFLQNYERLARPGSEVSNVSSCPPIIREICHYT